jgi:hypothetical protein
VIRRGLAGIAIASVVVAGLAGCGSGSGDQAGVSIKTLRAAADNSQGAASTSFASTFVISSRGKTVEMHGTGAVTSDGQQGQITLDVADEGSMEERITPDGIYIDFGGIPRLARELPDGKRWLFISYDALSAEAGTDYRALLGGGQTSNPQQGLEYLQATSGDVTKVGDDTVGGAHATHYRTTIDYAKYADEKLADAKPAVRDKVAALGKVPADVWINDSDRVVKTHFAVDATAFGAASGSAEMTMEITGFGVPVNVEAPPADQTVDVSDVAGSQSTASSTAIS